MLHMGGSSVTTPAINAHFPALTLQEAAMLPALQPQPVRPRVPKNLLVPSGHLRFLPAALGSDAAAARPVRVGSSAGRAVLRAAGIAMPGIQTANPRK